LGIIGLRLLLSAESEASRQGAAERAADGRGLI
jgi:hypothetical protein